MSQSWRNCSEGAVRVGRHLPSDGSFKPNLLRGRINSGVGQLMPYVRVIVRKRMDDQFPALVEFTIVGVNGEDFHFVEKEPVVSAQPITSFPFEAAIECTALSYADHPSGSRMVEISTSPWGIESVAGLSRFWVCETQLVVPHGIA